MTVDVITTLKVAIVGSGPGGLAAAIQLGRLPYVELSVFEAARELREVGAGISINENTWRLLTELGAGHHLEPHYSAVRDGKKFDIQQRNGLTGELLGERLQDPSVPGPPTQRIERYKLQQALLKEVPQGLVQLSKRLASIEETASNQSLLHFTDSTTAGPFDLVIGADGIRSATRQHIYPTHTLSYTGKIAYRILIPQESVNHIKGIPEGPTFWHTPKTHVYTNPIPGGLFEIATRALVDEEEGKKGVWGKTVGKEEVVGHYQKYTDIIKQVIDVPETWLQFPIYGGPRVESVVHHGSIALIGDASHPLSGAFGSGAAFAFEDAYVIKQAIDYARSRGKNLGYALRLYDEVRSPHYKGLYAILDNGAAVAKEIRATTPPLSDDDIVKKTVGAMFGGNTGWIYKYNIINTWAERAALEDSNVDQVQTVPQKKIEKPIEPLENLSELKSVLATA